MTTLAAVPRKKLGDLVEARAKTLAGVTVYRGEVPGKPPVIQTGGAADSSGRVAPYVVLYTGAGTPSDELDVADAAVDLVWSWQVTCVAGYEADCGRLVDRVDELFYRWTPDRGAIDGLNFGRTKPPLGFDPGFIRRDEAVTPNRFWLPLQYLLPVTT